MIVYDSSPEAKLALARCMRLAAALSATVDVVSVVDPEKPNTACRTQLSRHAFSRLEMLAEEAVDEATTQFGENGIIAHGYVTFGRMLDALPGHARALRSDVVMIGHRGLDRIFRWWGKRPIHAGFAERLRGLTLVTVTSQ